MPQIQANGIQIEYETLGDPAAPPVLLIMGLGAQLIRWPERFCQGLAAAGHHVIRFDNRDIGLSGKLPQGGRPPLARVGIQASLGLPMAPPPYTLYDMAEDAAALLTALGLPSAHVIGASMGGMIGQILAARRGDRVRSFVSIMSTSGSRDLPGPDWRIRLALVRPFPKNDREARIRRTMAVLRQIGSPAYPRDEFDLRAQVTRELDRSDHIPGYLRQLWAILASPSRLPLLPQIQVPTLVIHGADDPLVPVAAAADLQRRIPGAELSIIPGMGHELPPRILDQVTARIVEHLRRGEALQQGSGPR